MALALNDRVQETGTANTTVSFTMSGAVAGYQSFSVVGNGNTTYYAATDTSNNWEVGLGTYSTTGPTLTRTTILSSSNSNAAVTFVGTVTIFLTYPASKSINKDASGNVSGYVIESSTIGATTPSTGKFTTVSLTGTTDQISSVAVSSDPAAPSASNLKTFAKTIAGGYTAPAFLNATNAVVQLQPAFANKKISILTNGPGSGVVNTSMGSFTGTATGVAPATTSMFTRAFRSTVVSTSTAGTFGNYYQTTAGYTLGSATAPAYGGFYYVIRFGIGDTVAAPRTFVGISSTTGAPTNVEPSTLTNSIGVGQGAADTNLKVYYGGSAAQTVIDLGASFPTNTSNTDWYELTLFAPPTSNNTVYYQVVRLNTGDKASGTLTGTAGTALPANTTLLALRNWRTNNATAAIVTLALGNMYLETDY